MAGAYLLIVPERLPPLGAGFEAARMRCQVARVPEAIGPAALFLHHDVRDEAEWQRVVAETQRAFGRLDVLVNNAGLVVFSSVEDCTLDDFRRLNSVMQAWGSSRREAKASPRTSPTWCCSSPRKSRARSRAPS